MDVATIKEKMQPKTTAHGTVISMPTFEEAAWLVTEVERLTKEDTSHKEFTVARVKVLAEKLDCTNGLPDDATIYGCIGTILGTFRHRVERITAERDRYKAALETIAMLATDTEPEE